MFNQINFLKNILFLITALAIFQSCEFNISTASINNVKLCTDITGDELLCQSDQSDFTRTSAKFIASCEILNAPEDTEVTFAWYYTSETQQLIDQVTLKAGDVEGGGSSFNMYSNLNSPETGWPAGDYEVVITLNTDNSTPVSRKFSIS